MADPRMSSALNGLRILVTGGAGFVGSHLVKRLVAEGAQVMVTYRPGGSLLRLDLNGTKHAVRMAAVELTNFGALSEVFGDFRPEVVFHLAAVGVKAGSTTDQDTIAANLLCGAAVAHACARHGVRRLVFMGSGSEYALGNTGRISESSPLEPATAYGAAKTAAWHVARGYAESVPFELVVVRLFSTFGPAENTSRLVPYVICNALRGQPVEISTGIQSRDYLFVEDVVSALVLVAVAPGAVGKVYNLGSGLALPVREFVEMIAGEVDAATRIDVGKRGMARPESLFFVAENIRLLQLGWAPTYGLKEGISLTVEWYRSYLSVAGLLT